MLIDTHAHLYWESFNRDFDEVIQRATNAGISTIINVGVDVEKSKEALQVSKKLALSEASPEAGEVEGYSTIGIHPHEALRLAPLAQGKPLDIGVSIRHDIEKLKEIYLSDTTKVVAVGECGLDYLFDPGFTPSDLSLIQLKQLQCQLFQAQIDLAKKLKLPLVVHCRDDRGSTSSPPTKTSSSSAWDEVVEMTKSHFGIYHCYSGLPQTTNRILKTTNFLVSFATNITYPKNEYLREAAKTLPLERIVLETDSPFLSPQSKRGQRNEPANVKEIAELVADLKGITLKEVADQTTRNAKKVFNISTNFAVT